MVIDPFRDGLERGVVSMLSDILKTLALRILETLGKGTLKSLEMEMM